MQGEGELEARILRILGESGGLTMEELVERLGWSGDRRPLRRAVASLVRKGLVVKVPDYSRGKVVLKAAGGSRPGRSGGRPP
ncbi:MarR family transcriptional regulator [Aeropyrum pernix]|uniref:MarR family transcriptional regulator n=1 Tax=Aeropyrum pernix TaxID=56636 RepID=A0A401H8P1_AERPX|nr:helix-turn-helix domain-containing protein [Aeropyrum pernix]GBF08815.1 MarR family transcriptional regulator [Aeropyrum pernix]